MHYEDGGMEALLKTGSVDSRSCLELHAQCSGLELRSQNAPTQRAKQAQRGRAVQIGLHGDDHKTSKTNLRALFFWQLNEGR